jgi:hypothetical protein
MSLSKTLSTPFEIHPDVHHEPRARCLAWKAVIFELAILQCQTQHVSGCLFMVQTDADAEYTAFPLHWDAGAGGQRTGYPTIQHPTTCCGVPPHPPPMMPLP